MKAENSEEVPRLHSGRKGLSPLRKSPKCLIIGLVVAILLICTLVLGYFLGVYVGGSKKVDVEVPDPFLPPPPSPSKLRVFQNAAVCTDAPECSKIGSQILMKGGSAVDAAIAAMFCNSLFNHQSMGLGGGFFMTFFKKDENRSYSVVAREMAPQAAYPDMFHGNPDVASKGALSIGVPGELRGLWLAHRNWGLLSWEQLVAPTIEHCRQGYPMSKALHHGLLLAASAIMNDPLLRKMYYDENRIAFYPPGSVVRPPPVLCNTLETIALEGGDALYNGSLANAFAQDLKKAGSIITPDDLMNYQAKISEPLMVHLSYGQKLFVPPAPSSGALLAYILNVLSAYHFSPESITTMDRAILTYHRIIETFKFAYGMRTKLGDPDFVDIHELIRNMTSKEFADVTLLSIDDQFANNNTKHYGAQTHSKYDAGTAHLSIIAPNGDAVSVTSSINYYFGSGVVSHSTGIVLNNVMDDFSAPGVTNSFGLPPSPANFIAPGKRPMSSMSPAIIVNAEGNAQVVVGASGGTKITTAVSMAITRMLWFGQTVKEAVDAPRIHHQIFPMYVEYEYGNTEDIVSGLRAKGHGMVRYRNRGSIVCALYRNHTAIYANADFRKGGDVEGL